MNLDKYKKFWPILEQVAAMSKDPSTKVGCLILSPDFNILATGYNGFPRGVKDMSERLEDRSIKYPLTVHAEANAVSMAARQGHRLDGSTAMISALYACSPCAGLLVQAGIRNVISPAWDTDPRWADSAKLAKLIFEEAGLNVYTYCNDTIY